MELNWPKKFADWGKANQQSKMSLEEELFSSSWYHALKSLNTPCELLPPLPITPKNCKCSLASCLEQGQSYMGPASSCRLLFLGDYPRFQVSAGNKKSQVFSEEIDELFFKMIQAMKLTTHDYAITLCGRCPVSSELAQDSLSLKKMLETCSTHWKQEIIQLRPEIVVSLGPLSTNILFGHNQHRLSQVHGQFLSHSIDWQSENHSFQVMPVFHPEFLLINPSMKRPAWNDLQKVMKFLNSTT